MASAANANLHAVRETMDVLLEISRLLNTGLDMESLSICVRLCEQGINPEALSAVIKELRKASETLKASENCTNWSCHLISSVWTLMGSCPVPGSVPTMGSPANHTCLCVGTLSSASPRRRFLFCALTCVLSFCVEVYQPQSSSWTQVFSRHKGTLGHSASDLLATFSYSHL